MIVQGRNVFQVINLRPELSEIVQNMAFKLRYKWNVKCKEVHNEEAPYLVFNQYLLGEIRYGFEIYSKNEECDTYDINTVNMSFLYDTFKKYIQPTYIELSEQSMVVVVGRVFVVDEQGVTVIKYEIREYIYDELFSLFEYCED